jgi:cytochrome c peroxidase
MVRKSIGSGGSMRRMVSLAGAAARALARAVRCLTMALMVGGAILGATAFAADADRALRPVVAASANGGAVGGAVGGARDAAALEAGRRLFFDPLLSDPPGTPCAACHDPARAFTGDNGSGTAVARGSRAAERGTRNAPSLMYLASSPRPGMATKEGKPVPRGGFFWDGRAATLAEQALGPLFAANEMNNRDAAALVARVAASDAAPWLRQAYGAGVLADPARGLQAITEALAAFEQSAAFAPFTSKFDAVLRGEAQFTPQEQRGQSLFAIAQKGNCASCHTMDATSGDPRDSLFTDFAFHALGVPRNPAVAQPGQFDLGYCAAQPGGAQADAKWCGWFKTPTLRNVALTAPYMHNGRFATLREAVAFYATRDTHPERWYPGREKFDDLPPDMHANVDVESRPYHRRPGQRPALNDDEIDDIVAFLQTLTDATAP